MSMVSLPGLPERDSNTDSHAIEIDLMRTRDYGFIGVSLPRRLDIKL